MTAPAVVVSRLRCPQPLATGGVCGHFPQRIAEHSELITELGEWKHAIYALDDRGHMWTTSWMTEKEMT